MTYKHMPTVKSTIKYINSEHNKQTKIKIKTPQIQ